MQNCELLGQLEAQPARWLSKVKNRKGAKPNKSLDPTAEAAGSTSTTGNDTPNVDANKRKHTDTPNSAKPLMKRTYAGSVALDGSGADGTFPKSKKMAHTLWVHTNDVEKGEISQNYFFEVISCCNVIKVNGFLEGKTEFSWCPDMRGQPTYDSDHARGKIVCFDLQTINFCRILTSLSLPFRSAILPAKLGLGRSMRFQRSSTPA